ncbi:MAG: hypothetical protein K8R85_03630 [Bacteroidetes bacterium]|nr:hypothetical protein [Bacteroidota bacterium]
MTANFLGGNAYETVSNNGELMFTIHPIETPKTSPQINYNFDVYSSCKKPVTINISRNNKVILLSNNHRDEFVLGELSNIDSVCNYDCNVLFNATDKITFKSKLSIFKHWNGLHILSNSPLFIRYHYYTLKIKKISGKVLIARWRYNVHKHKNSMNEKHWSGDSNGGLIKMRIKN